MGLNIEHALNYMFKDNSWKKKFLIGCLFTIGMVIMNIIRELSKTLSHMKPEQLKPYLNLLPAVMIIGGILFLVAFILNIYSTGYLAKNINLRIFKPEANLLEWDNWKNMFAVGFKATAAALIYITIFVLICCVPIFAAIGLIITLNKIAMAIAFFAALSIIFIASIIFSFYIGAAALAFNTDLKFSSYFNVSLIKKFITKNFLGFFIYMILIFAISIVANIINSILLLTIVGTVFMPAVYFYQFLVQNELAAQFIRETMDLPITE